MPENEVEKFLADTDTDPTKVDVLEASLLPEAAEEPASSEEPQDAQPKNRRERRLLQKLHDERESSMFLAGKLEARSEAERFVNDESDYLKGIEGIYGTDSPEAQLATDLLKKALVGIRDEAENRAYERVMSERQQESTELKQAENELDSFIEEIEDEYSVTLTDAQERAYFSLLERMSPKDREGNVIEYADPHAVWEVFSEKLKARPSQSTNQAKDLSSRSMVNSGASAESNLQNDVMTRFLQERGII